MISRPIASALLLVISTTLASAHSPGPAITLVHQRKIDGVFDALPRLKPMPGIAYERINSALARLDADAREMLKDKDCTYDREVSIPMAGPNFLTVRLDEYSYCGGPHPNSDVSAITYDLTTGKPVDWVALLGSKLGGTTELNEKTKKPTGNLSSPALFKLWKEARDSSDSSESEEADKSEDNSCADIPSENTGALSVWADAAGGGIAVQSTDVGHATEVCGRPAVIPLSVLRGKGVSAQLLDSIAAGRRSATRSH